MPRLSVTTDPVRRSTRIRDAAIAKAVPPPPAAALRRAAKVRVAPPPKTVPKCARMVAYNLRKQTGGNFALSAFTVGRVLGKGGLAKVFLATINKDKVKIALKKIANIIRDVDGTIDNRRDLIKREIDFHKNLNHGNILRVYGYFWDRDHTYLVMELAGKDLYKMTYRDALDEKTAAQYIYQIADALNYCHSKNVFHRDIKRENILIGSDGKLKLSDFGCSINKSNRRTSFDIGTTISLAPEVLNKKDYYGAQADLWALGVLAYDLLIGRGPFEGDDEEELTTLIKKGKFEFPRRPKISNQAKDLISGLLKKKPENRMKLEEVLTHQWIMTHKILG